VRKHARVKGEKRCMTSDPYMKWELSSYFIVVFFLSLSLCPVRIGMDAQDLKSEFYPVLEC
jgi:hypothetical protein